MQLRHLITETNLLEIHGSTSMDITGIAYDSRRVLPGDLFVDLQREPAGDQAETDLALERGAAAVVCRRNGSLRVRGTRIEVTDTRLALAELSATFYQNAGAKLHIIGITGGANTWKTAHLTKQLLQSAGIKTGLISSLRHEIGERVLPGGHFVESSDIQRLFAGMVRAGCAACVLELPGISPVALKGIPLNVLVYEGGEQNLRALSLFLQSRQGAPVCGIVNLDHENGRAVAQSTTFKMQLTFGYADEAEVSASEVTVTTGGTRFLLNLVGHSAACNLPLVGKDNIRAVLGAAAASLSSLTPRQVLAGLSAVRGVPSSLEVVANDHGISVYIDQAGRAATLAPVLATLGELKAGRILLALGSPERTSGKDRYDLGRAAGQYADHLILTSDNPGCEDQEEICAALAQGIESVGRSTYHLQPDRVQAIRELIAMAEPGDIVLIAGKGERTHQIVGNTAVPFSDREVATNFLESYAAAPARTNAGRALCAA